MIFIEPTKGQTESSWADIDWHAVETNVKRLQERIYRATTNPVMSRCPYPDGRRSNPTCEAPGTMIRPLPALRRRRTREGSEG